MRTWTSRAILSYLAAAAAVSLAAAGCGDNNTGGPKCGNRVVETGEQCDDGNTANGDGCSSICRTEGGGPVCGNSVVETGEDCDPPDGTTCDTTCHTIAGGSETGLCADGQDNDSDGSTDCDDSDCTDDPACNPVLPESDCGDGVDNDGDGLTDCDDSDCLNDPACVGLVELDCADGVDNDDDGLTDCEDSDCALDPACEVLGELDCADQVDNDNDGLTDCADSDCAADPACVVGGGATGTACTVDGMCTSNAGDDALCLDEVNFGLPSGYCSEFCDLAAPDCADGATCVDPNGGGIGICFDNCDPAVNPPLSDCRNGYLCADIGIGQALCLPFCTSDDQCPATGRCDPSGVCTPPEICDNQTDDDFDGLTDCADDDCLADPACVVGECGDGLVQPPETCDPPDGVTCDDTCQGIPETGHCDDAADNDGDFLIDCNDPDCAGDPACPLAVCGDGTVTPPETCDPPDGVTCGDNCQLILGNEICENGLVDDDFNGFADCADPSCQALNNDICVPGTQIAGSACQHHNECESVNGTPACITDFAGLTWTDGYCSEFCPLASGDCASGTCRDVGLGNGYGICLDGCVVNHNTFPAPQGDCRADYQCVKLQGPGRFCIPL